MTTFSVWAPSAKSVDIVDVSGDRRSMTKVGEYFSADVPEWSVGTRYKFSLDGGEPLPDPRSMYQPDGVHGSSEVVDHRDYRWNDQDWRGFHLPSAVIYELHIGTFTNEGTFDSAIERLDHLVELGIDAVELLPPVEFPGERGWGYDGVYLFAPHHSYGGPEGLKRFVDACHERGLGVIIDCVYNHLGPDGNYLGAYGPYFTDRYQTPWGQAVNYDDRGSDEVRRFVLDNVTMWFRDYHVDALRLDAVHAIYDFSATHLLREMQILVDDLTNEVRRPLHLIAESDLNDPRVVEPPGIGGHGLAAQWSDDFHHALHAWLTGENNGYYAEFGSLDTLVESLNDAFVGAGEPSEFRGRSHGRSATHLPAYQFVGYLQNHDQVGNRAVGERSAALMSPERLRIGAAVVLLSPFVPMLFQGEEWGADTSFQYFTDHIDPELGEAVSQGRRSEFSSFGWDPESVPDPQDKETFERSKLNWEELSDKQHADLYDWHRKLIALRRSEPSLVQGRNDFDCFADGDVLVMMRSDITLVANLGAGEVRQDVAPASELFLSSPETVTLSDGVLLLPADGVAVLREG